MAGVGHDPGKQFTDHWWDNVFNSAAKNVQVDVKKVCAFVCGAFIGLFLFNFSESVSPKYVYLFHILQGTTNNTVDFHFLETKCTECSWD